MGTSYLAGCDATDPSPRSDSTPISTSTPSRADARTGGWLADIAALKEGIENTHPDPWHGLSEKRFDSSLEKLRSEVATGSNDELMVGIVEAVASLSAKGRDAHTGAFVWGTGDYPTHSLPLRLWFFADGLFVVDALPPYRSLVGTRVTSLAGHPIVSVVHHIAPLVSHDNATTIELVTPRFLLIPEILHGLGLLKDARRVEVGIVDAEGHERSVRMTPVGMSDYNEWATPYGLNLPPHGGAAYLEDQDRPLFVRHLEGNVLDVRYNRVEFLEDDTIASLRRAIDRSRAVVIDLRHNFGGETHAFEPVLAAVVRAIGDKPLYVLIGRNTFSAATLFAARLEQRTNAVFVGEPTGGGPNFYADTEDFDLEYSGITITVATTYQTSTGRKDHRLTISPDIPVDLTSKDYFAGRDPILETVLGRL